MISFILFLVAYSCLFLACSMASLRMLGRAVICFGIALAIRNWLGW